MLNRRGFTLIEIVIAIGIIAVLAGVMIPSLFRRSEDAQSSLMLQTISSLVTAMHGFHSDVGRYPSRLVMLTTAPTVTSRDICNFTMPEFASWSGPYLERSLIASGLPVGTGVMTDTITRDPLSNNVMTTAAGNGIFTARDIEQSVALAVDRELDGDGLLTTGAVRWTVSSGTRGSLFYRFPLRGC